jgi:glycosyltransferase involved in cell wall biosynthesis
MSAPLVSIIIPCYNAEKFIRRTIASVLRNSYRPIEILVVDDGSKDGSLELARSLAARHPEVSVFHKENGGVSSARNFGIKRAKGDYIALLDADDLFYPDCVAKRMQAFITEDEPDLLGVYCPAALVDEKGIPLMQAPFFSPYLPNDRFYYSSSPHCVFIPSIAILKKSKMLECGLFDETICPAEDYDLWHRMLRRGGYFRIVRSCLVGWVQHKDSATHKQILHHQRRVKKVVKKMFDPDPATTVTEYQKSYGDMFFHQTLSGNAFNSAIMAVTSGHLDVACEITKDISYFFLERLEPKSFEYEIRAAASRSLCKSETLWLSEIWPGIRGHVCTYFEFLQRRYDAELPTLKRALELLEKEPDLELAVKK